jgi:Peptidase family M28/PDZ domain/PA domain
MALVVPQLHSRAEDATGVEARLARSAKYLSSDELEGRGVGTKGLNLAADYIAAQFREIGLKTDLFDGTPFQRFQMVTGATLGADNHIEFVGPKETEAKSARTPLKLGQDFNPLAIGGSGKFDLPLVFVGYGITSKDPKYDDYAGADVKGKAVIVLRHQPQQSNPHGLFGSKRSQHAAFRRKISNAYEHGAAAVIFTNDQFDAQKTATAMRQRWEATIDQISEARTKFKSIDKPSAEDWNQYEERMQALADDLKKFTSEAHEALDPLLPFEGAGSDPTEARNFPVLFVKPTALDPILRAASGKSLAELETQIDKDGTPHSQVLERWRITGETSIERQEAEVKNVLGVLEGSGPLAEETIVIGAHYDHLGYGGAGSAAPGVKEIHNGADDNGSGTTVLIEVARRLAARSQHLPRRIVFIAFTGEERGLIGSARYVREPLFPLDRTVAMLNLDLVGRMESDKLIVHGTGTAEEFDALVDRLASKQNFQLTKKPGGFGPSDHQSFYAAKVPVLFFFTGSHKDYHRPTDDFEKLNLAGMRRVADLVVDAAVTLAEAPARPRYLEEKAGETLGGGGDRPYFGSIPDFAQEQTGYALSGVSKGGPAERAGMKAGDIIIQFGESQIGNLEDFDSALRKYKAGDKVKVTVKRGDTPVTLEVLLDPPR